MTRDDEIKQVMDKAIRTLTESGTSGLYAGLKDVYNLGRKHGDEDSPLKNKLKELEVDLRKYQADIDEFREILEKRFSK